MSKQLTQNFQALYWEPGQPAGFHRLWCYDRRNHGLVVQRTDGSVLWRVFTGYLWPDANDELAAAHGAICYNLVDRQALAGVGITSPTLVHGRYIEGTAPDLTRAKSEVEKTVNLIRLRLTRPASQASRQREIDTATWALRRYMARLRQVSRAVTTLAVVSLVLVVAAFALVKAGFGEVGAFLASAAPFIGVVVALEVRR